MDKIGYIINTTSYYAVLIIPYHYSMSKYSKVQLNQKKYFILNFRKEYKKGDIVYFNTIKRRIYKILN